MDIIVLARLTEPERAPAGGSRGGRGNEKETASTSTKRPPLGTWSRRTGAVTAVTASVAIEERRGFVLAMRSRCAASEK